VRETIYRLHVNSEAVAIASKSSLSVFQTLRPHRVCSQGERLFPLYLVGHSNVRGARLKTKLRLGHVMLMPTVAKLLGNPPSGGTCLVCGEELESVCHFLARCAPLQPCRNRFARQVQELRRFGPPGLFLMYSVLNTPVDRFTHLLLVDGDFPFPGLLASARYSNYCALARWYLDSCVKNLITSLWDCRASIVGTFVPTKSHPALRRVAPASSFRDLIMRRDSPIRPLVELPPRCYWKRWIILPPRSVPWSCALRKTSNSNIYVTWEGRSSLLF
jgi:hypothetical protein